MMTTQLEPLWLAAARRDVGLRETLGPNDSPWLRRVLGALGAKWLLGQPWCGGAVAHWMAQAGLSRPKAWYRARAWLNWGEHIVLPAVGAVVVFERQGGGHVGLVVGLDQRGRLMVLGGNQGDAVSIAPFDRSRVLGFRWPSEQIALLRNEPLPFVAAAGPSSTNEA
jgi:uncharacterized protein (TIGR02594 family)